MSSTLTFARSFHSWHCKVAAEDARLYWSSGTSNLGRIPQLARIACPRLGAARALIACPAGKPKVSKPQQKTKKRIRSLFSTDLGQLYVGKSEEVLRRQTFNKYHGKCQLIFTSPPFALTRQKDYKNVSAVDYADWLAQFAKLFTKFLTPTGSIVMEVGNSWEPDKPVMSTARLEALLAFKKKAKLHLCQEFVWYNPARLPSPAEWVNVRRIRLKDAITHIWWMSASDQPKADNRKVLKPYSRSMQALIKRQSYNSGTRPSGHNIGKKSFLKDNGGAIASNAIDGDLVPNLLKIGNTGYNKEYLDFCKDSHLLSHPARMPPHLPDFFIRFLTDENDIVMDPFAGSNTTGQVAEKLKRRWLSIEASNEYAIGSVAAFDQAQAKALLSHQVSHLPLPASA